MSYAILKKNG